MTSRTIVGPAVIAAACLAALCMNLYSQPLVIVTPRVTPVTTTPAGGTRPASRPASHPATSSAPAVSADVILKLIADLDSADWRRREQATAQLVALGPQVKALCRKAVDADGSSLELKTRAQMVLTKLLSADCPILGTWEVQPWGDITCKDKLVIYLNKAGDLQVGPARDAPYTNSFFSKISFDGKTFRFHEVSNPGPNDPGYLFDCELKLVKEGEMLGTRIRTNPNPDKWEMKMLYVGPGDESTIAKPTPPGN